MVMEPILILRSILILSTFIKIEGKMIWSKTITADGC